MKNKILIIVFLFVLFLIYLFIVNQKTSFPLYKILKVVEADKFYIDINKNNKIDDGELFKLINVYAFVPEYNDYTKNEAQKLSLDIFDFLKAGYLAKSFAKDNLENSFVEVVSIIPNNDKIKKYGYVSFNFKYGDYEKFLLNNGLGYIKPNTTNNKYIQAQNIPQAKNNIKEISKIEFYLLNTNSDIIHKINCPFAKEIRNALLVTKKDSLIYPKCGICFNDEVRNNLFNIEKSKNKYTDSPVLKAENIQLFLINPLVFKKPNPNCTTPVCKALLNEINNAEESIDIALYGFGEQKEILNALKNAKKRGVKIRCVIDYSKNMYDIYPRTKEFQDEFNPKTDSLTGSIMHNKFFIFDDKKVFSGSMNVSSSGTGGYSANLGILINSSDIAKIYKKEFNQMYGGKFSTFKSKISSPNVKIGETNISVYFSPMGNIYDEAILPVIKNANKEIIVSAFYLTERNLIDELINSQKRNVKVYVIMDAVGASNFKDRINELRNSGVKVLVENWGGKNHEKTIVVDSRIMLLGSANFSKSAFYKNDENIIKINNKYFASGYRDYFLYLFNSADKKYLEYFPSAEGLESVNSCFDGIDNDFDGKIDSLDEGCMLKK